jgi:acetyltransferase-like isoleucine patch superfamily enzyme
MNHERERAPHPGAVVEEQTQSAGTTFRMQLIASDVHIGRNVAIRDFVNLYGCSIGDNSRIGTFVEIQKGSRIGRNCKISSHTFICEGVQIDDDVFIGHGVMFTNDAYPRATASDGTLKTDADWICVPTHIARWAAIGSGATLLCGITIGEGAIVGAGSVVTKDVAPYMVVAGNPARPLRPVPDRPAAAVVQPSNVAEQTT